MAKPNAQTGHGSFSGAADESALPNGETSRRGADENAESAKSDWGLPDSTDESRLSRILGLILVLVLVGVFSFVAYRKYNEARLHPADNTLADISGTAPAHAGSEPAAGQPSENGNAPETGNPPPDRAYSNVATSAADGANPAPKSNAAAPSAFQQLDEQSNPNAPFHPTRSRSVGGQPAEASQTDRSGRSSQTTAKESDVNPFSDVASNTTATPPATEQAPQSNTAHVHVANANPLASEEPRNDQTEPLFNEAAGQRSSSETHQHGGTTAKVAANLAPNPDGGNDSTGPQSGRPSAQAMPVHLQSVQTAQNEQFTPTRVAAAPNPPAQSEPATNDSLNDPPKATDVARHDQRSAAESSESTRQKAPAAGLLDQEEPLETAPKSQPNAGGSPSSQIEAQTAQSSSKGWVQPSPASTSRVQARVRDNEDLFGSKTADAKSASDPTPIAQKQTATSAAGVGGADADTALNEAGDSYVVQPQDNFWTISRKKYGTARYFMALAQLNKAHVPDPARMRPGVKVSTPPTEILETRFAQYLPKGSGVEVTSGERQAVKPAPTGFYVNADGRPMYRTGEKDTLSDIAAKHLGRASRWIQIFEMNRDKLSTPNQLKIGTELALPGDASNVAITNENEDRR
jgi:nucleoid-associated protein YgaU